MNSTRGGGVNESLMDESRLRHMEKFERFGLQLFRQDHLHQYLDFLKGMQKEMEIGDFYDAKKHYIDSLINRAFVNHRIRKEALLRLMFINKRIPKEIGAPKDSPEKILVTRYYI